MNTLGRTIRGILVPLALFLAFGAATLFAPEITTMVGAAAALRLGDVLFYAVEIGLWLSGAYLLARLVNHLLWDRLALASGRGVPALVRNLIALIIFVAAISGIVGVVFHQSVAGIWATSGAFGIVLGLALRGIILDIFSGIAINIDQSYRIGDWIEVLDHGAGGPVYGKVIDINWRTTRIEGDDKRVFLVPNGKVSMATVVNSSLPTDVTRFEFSVILDFTVPTERAVRVMLAGIKAAQSTKGIAEKPEPSVIIGAVTPVGIDYKVRFWAEVSRIPVNVARGVVAASVVRHLERAGLTPAVPKQDLFHARLPERLLEHRSEAERARLLAHVDILAGLNAEELGRLAVAMTPRQLAKSETLVKQGDETGSMFVLAEGLLEVWAEGAAGPIRVARIEPTEFAGEMSLLTGEPRSATITAATEALVYEITREHLTPILTARPALFEAISELVAKRRLRTTSRLAEVAAPSESAEVLSVSAQILGKMRLLFRQIGQRRAPLPAESGRLR